MALTFSLSLNLALGVALLLALRPKPQGEAGWPLPAQAAHVPVQTNLPAIIEPAPAGFVFRTNRFHWARLESTNYLTYATNLRQVGCPEKTVRDILQAEIAEDFDNREAAINVPIPYWTVGAARDEAAREERRLKQELWRTRSELLAQLGLPEDLPEDSDNSGSIYAAAISFFILGPTSFNKARAVAEGMRRGERIEREVREQTAELPEEEEEAMLQAARRKLYEKLTSELSPAERDEFTLRLAALGLRENVIEDFVPTTAEFRGMATLYREVSQGGVHPEAFIDPDDLTDEQRAQLRPRLRALLGDYRYGQLAEKGDSSFFQ